MAPMLYVAVIPLLAISLLYPIYTSANIPYLQIIHDHSIITLFSPVMLKSVIIYVLNSLFSISSRANAIKLPPISKLQDSFGRLFTQDSFVAIIAAARWAILKLSTCEISQTITVTMISIATKFVKVIYLRLLVSLIALTVTIHSVSYPPAQRATIRAATRQFKCMICSLCGIIFTVIEFLATALNTLSTLRRMSQECDRLEGTRACNPWWELGCKLLFATMVVVTLYTVVMVVLIGVDNILESWRFVGVAQEKEASERAEQVETMERVVNVMKDNGRLIGAVKEDHMQDALHEIIRLYDGDESPRESGK